MDILIASLQILSHLFSKEFSITKESDLVELNASPLETSTSIILPEGYMIFPFNNAAYKIYKNVVTWAEANERCISDGGHLAIADTFDKIADIKSIKNQDYWLHVGIHKLTEAQGWTRVDNELPLTSLPWAWYEPNRNGEACTAIPLSGDGLIDHDCTLRAQSVCEISINRY